MPFPANTHPDRVHVYQPPDTQFLHSMSCDTLPEAIKTVGATHPPYSLMQSSSPDDPISLNAIQAHALMTHWLVSELRVLQHLNDDLSEPNRAHFVRHGQRPLVVWRDCDPERGAFRYAFFIAPVTSQDHFIVTSRPWPELGYPELLLPNNPHPTVQESGLIL